MPLRSRQIAGGLLYGMPLVRAHSTNFGIVSWYLAVDITVEIRQWQFGVRFCFGHYTIDLLTNLQVDFLCTEIFMWFFLKKDCELWWTWRYYFGEFVSGILTTDIQYFFLGFVSLRICNNLTKDALEITKKNQIINQ